MSFRCSSPLNHRILSFPTDLFSLLVFQNANWVKLPVQNQATHFCKSRGVFCYDSAKLTPLSKQSKLKPIITNSFEMLLI